MAVLCSSSYSQELRCDSRVCAVPRKCHETSGGTRGGGAPCWFSFFKGPTRRAVFALLLLCCRGTRWPKRVHMARGISCGRGGVQGDGKTGMTQSGRSARLHRPFGWDAMVISLHRFECH